MSNELLQQLLEPVFSYSCPAFYFSMSRFGFYYSLTCLCLALFVGLMIALIMALPKVLLTFLVFLDNKIKKQSNRSQPPPEPQPVASQPLPVAQPIPVQHGYPANQPTEVPNPTPDTHQPHR